MPSPVRLLAATARTGGACGGSIHGYGTIWNGDVRDVADTDGGVGGCREVPGEAGDDSGPRVHGVHDGATGWPNGSAGETDEARGSVVDFEWSASGVDADPAW